VMNQPVQVVKNFFNGIIIYVAHVMPPQLNVIWKWSRPP
jgi:hypothetical protein